MEQKLEIIMVNTGVKDKDESNLANSDIKQRSVNKKIAINSVCEEEDPTNQTKKKKFKEVIKQNFTEMKN